jgi:hypothetical protein
VGVGVAVAAAPPSVAATAAAPDPGGRDAAAATEQGKYSITTLRYQVIERLSFVVALRLSFRSIGSVLVIGLFQNFSAVLGIRDILVRIRTSD